MTNTTDRPANLLSTLGIDVDRHESPLHSHKASVSGWADNPWPVMDKPGFRMDLRRPADVQMPNVSDYVER